MISMWSLIFSFVKDFVCKIYSNYIPWLDFNFYIGFCMQIQADVHQMGMDVVPRCRVEMFILKGKTAFKLCKAKCLLMLTRYPLCACSSPFSRGEAPEGRPGKPDFVTCSRCRNMKVKKETSFAWKFCFFILRIQHSISPPYPPLKLCALQEPDPNNQIFHYLKILIIFRTMHALNVFHDSYPSHECYIFHEFNTPFISPGDFLHVW